MAGNVWERTRSLWGKKWSKLVFKYPYRVDDGRENLKVGDDFARVLRGGASHSDAGDVRCAVRLPDGRINLNWVYGFRVCVAAQRD